MTKASQTPIIRVFFYCCQEASGMAINEEKLLKHPWVNDVFDGRVRLKTKYKIRLFTAWKKEKLPRVIRGILEENGLGEDVAGEELCTDLENSFTMRGFPRYTREEMADAGFKEENPLVLSGMFIRNKTIGSTDMTEETTEKLYSVFPDITVAEALSMNRIDPDYLGLAWIQSCSSKFNRRLNREAKRGAKEIKGDLSEKIARSRAIVIENLKVHPYVKIVELDGSIEMNDAFFNETMLLEHADMDELLWIYEIDAAVITTTSRLELESRRKFWHETRERITDNAAADQYHMNLINAMHREIVRNYAEIGKMLPDLSPMEKRRIYLSLNDIPPDINGMYKRDSLLKLMHIKKSSFYASLKRELSRTHSRRSRPGEEAEVSAILKTIDYKGFRKGSRQIYMLLPKITGLKIGLHRIQKLMRTYGLSTEIRKASRSKQRIKELIERNKKANLLARKFRLHRPNEVRLTDVTYISYGDGKRAYGSASIDPVTGKLIAFIISERNDLTLAMDTLRAMDHYPVVSGGILHSDQGILYFNDAFQRKVAEMALNQSMSRRGNCWDNSPMESFFGHFKDECPYRNCTTIQELIVLVDKYSQYYNTERGMWHRQQMTPEEYEIYLSGLSEADFAAYIEEEQKKYEEMKEKAEKEAIMRAKAYTDPGGAVRNEIR